MAMFAANSDKKNEWSFLEVVEMYVSLFPNDMVEFVRNVLWIDRENSGKAAIISHLERRGFSITVIDNPLTAIQQLDNLFPDLIIIDFDLKPLTGLDVLELLHRDPTYHGIPVIMISGHEPARLVQERALVQMFGGVKLLNKPITIVTLLSALTQYFSPSPATPLAPTKNDAKTDGRLRPAPRR